MTPFNSDRTPLQRLLWLGGMARAAGKEVEDTATGNPLTFVTDLAKPLRSLLIPFTPVQTGTGDPSPENVRPISGWSGFDVFHSGINIWDEEWESGYYDGTTGEKVYHNNFWRCKNLISVVPGAKYAFIGKQIGEIGIRRYDRNGNFIGTILSKMTNKSYGFEFVVDDGAYFITFFVNNEGGTKATNVSINYPATETEYHPYTGQTYPVVFPALGKNKLDPSKPTVYTNSVYGLTLSWNTETGAINISGTYTGSSASTAFRCLSVPSALVGLGVKGFSESENFNLLRWQSGASQIVCELKGMVENASYNITIYPFVYDGETAPSAYEPYTNTIYGGTLDLVTGELWKTWESVDMGSLVWAYAQTTNFRLFYAPVGNAKSDTELFCEQYAKQNGNDANNSIRKYATGSGVVRVSVHDDRYNEYTEPQFKTAMDGVEIATTLATPVLVATLTPQQITALIGNNTIWSDTNGENTVVFMKKG